MNHSSSTRGVAALMGLLFAAGCSSSPNGDSNPSTTSGAAGSSAVNTYAPCHGTVSGAANGPFTCKSDAVLFLPTYQSDTLRGNTEFSFGSSTMLEMGMSPPGIKVMVLAAILPGEPKPGTYTEAQLLHTEYSASSLQFEDKQLPGGLTHLNLVVTGVTPGSVHEDVITGRGPTREYFVTGSIELVMSNGADEVTASAVMQ